MIGGLPLLQTLSITFTGSPIPFGKTKFPPKAIQDIVTNIKSAIQRGKSYMNELKKEFMNPLKDDLDRLKKDIDKLTDDDFAGLKAALPEFFANADTNVSAARAKLLEYLGNAQGAASQKFLGIPIGELSNLGDTLYDAFHSFRNHTNEISGVSTDDKAIILDTIEGNIVYQNALVNVNSTTVATLNSSATYPMIPLGTTVIINSQELLVVGKQYVSVSGGTVSVDILSDNVKVTSSSVSTLNLALSISPGMYINVNSSIKQVNTVNSYGDYLTVYTPFTKSNTGTTLYKESALVLNTAVSTTATNLTIAERTTFIANSSCLGNTITSVGVDFTTVLAANDKVYFDDKEYWVESVTATEIVVDDVTRDLINKPISKIITEYPLNQLTEGNSPDDILSHFATIEQMTNSMGENFMEGYWVRYQGSYGGYEIVPVEKPTDTVQSLEKGFLLNKMGLALQGIIDDLHADVINSLTNAELVVLINTKITEVTSIKNDLIDSVKRDLAAINAVKGLLKGLLKLFVMGCSKKKKSDGDTSSDDYLNMILIPNPQRLGCNATESDLPDILDESDLEFNDPELPERDTFVPEDDLTAVTSETDDEAVIVPDTEVAAGTDTSDVLIDSDIAVPEPPEDPCAKPC